MATDRIQYVAIGTWDHRDPQAMQAAFDAVKQAASKKTPLIIDVRPNSGGDESQAQRVASYFVSKPTPYAANRNWADGKLSSLYQRTLKPSEDEIVHPGPCVVLMGPQNMSSCESFLRMMKVAGATLVGMPTKGSSGNPKPHDLGNGVTIFLPTWQDCDLDGNVVEGKGIKPDVLVETKPEEFAKEDRVLAKALELLK
jgi:C-terminal processing protease CtpA/Prc